MVSQRRKVIISVIALAMLSLEHNQIENISPLVQDRGLRGWRDQIWLAENPLSADSIDVYVPQLEKRGVRVYLYLADE